MNIPKSLRIAFALCIYWEKLIIWLILNELKWSKPWAPLLKVYCIEIQIDGAFSAKSHSRNDIYVMLIIFNKLRSGFQ